MTDRIHYIYLLLLLLAGCSNGHQQVSKSASTSDQAVPSEARSAERRSRPPLHPRPPALKRRPTADLVKVYDFGEHLSAAHLSSGGLLVDFGTPARHKYTLGDWRSGFSGSYEEGETTYSYMTGRTARIQFTVLEGEEAEGGSIAFRMKGFGPHQVRVSLNDKSLGFVDLSADRFSHAVVPFEAGVRPGLNEIKLQSNARGKAPGGRVAVLAVDYVRVILGEAEGGPAASAFDAVRYRSETDGAEEIGLTAGESVTYYLPIPEGARLVGQALTRDDSGRGGQVSITVTGDGSKKPLSRTFDFARQGKALEVDLSEVDGEAAAITFAATQGEVLLKELGLYIPPPPVQKAAGDLGAKNLVLVLIDTLRADKLDIYNPETRVRTPYLSRLSKEAMTFEKALAPENWTKPSIATLLTGLYPTTHDTKDDRAKLPSTVTTIQEHLKSLGFVTAGFVANGYVSDKFGFRRGFDTWTNYVREGKRNRAQFVIEDAASWLQKKTDDKPFFLYVHTIDPHVPYIPPNKYLKMYDVGPYNGPVKGSATAKLAEQIKTHRVKLDDRDKMRFEALYDGEISYHDDQLVHLQEKLADTGLLEDTLLIVTSDHGEEFFEHGMVGHGHSLYEELIHVPLLIRLPGSDARTPGDGPTTAAEVSLADVFPTACELLGIECPGEVEGESLVTLLKGERAPFPSAEFSEFMGGQRAARMGRYKLILRGDRMTLFDLKRDPRETADASDLNPIALTAMRDVLGAHLGRFSHSPSPKGKKGEKPLHKAKKAVIDPETEKQLKALGYMGGE